MRTNNNVTSHFTDGKLKVSNLVSGESVQTELKIGDVQIHCIHVFSCLFFLSVNQVVCEFAAGVKGLSR